MRNDESAVRNTQCGLMKRSVMRAYKALSDNTYHPNYTLTKPNLADTSLNHFIRPGKTLVKLALPVFLFQLDTFPYLELLCLCYHVSTHWRVSDYN